MASLHDQLKALPTCPGVYFFYDAQGRLLYIGKSVNLRNRVRSYFRPNGGHTRRTERLKDEAETIEVQRCGTELEALLVESKAIKHMMPLYNVMGRTYKHYPFIRISDEPFPQVALTYQLQDDGAAYYGPFPSEYRARESLEAMRPLFKWRSCQPLAKTICFEHSIGRCSAPCVGKVDTLAYRQSIRELESFLTGDGGRYLSRLERQMEEAAESLMFERAAILRDRLAMLRPLVMRQNALQAAISELDCAVVLPAADPGKFLWLVVRRGRLVASETSVSLRSQSRVKRALTAAMEAPPPSLTVRQWELDEINIIASWLHKNRESENAFTLSGKDLGEVVAEGFAFMRRTGTQAASRPSARVAEKAAERVIQGPTG